jgi:hypothetical protein
MLIRCGRGFGQRDGGEVVEWGEATWDGGDSRALTMLSWGALLGGYVQFGETPLCMACQNGHKEVVKLLLARNVDVNYADEVRGKVWTAKMAWEAGNKAKRHGMEVAAL